MDVSSLSDEDLSSMLMEKGFTPGPILDTTRTVYERKLMRMLQGDVHAEGSYSHDTSDAVEYEEVVDDDTDVQAADTQPVPESLFQSRASPARPEPVYRSRPESSYASTSTSSGDTSYLTRRALHQPGRAAFNPADYVTQAAPPSAAAAQEQNNGLSLSSKLILVAMLAVIVFLVYYNMEPAAKDPLAGIATD